MSRQKAQIFCVVAPRMRSRLNFIGFLSDVVSFCQSLDWICSFCQRYGRKTLAEHAKVISVAQLPAELISTVNIDNSQTQIVDNAVEKEYQ